MHSAPHRRVPRAIIWVVLGAAAFAVTLSGAVGTALILDRSRALGHAIPAAFWLWLLAAACLTVASLAVRALRWAFLLRRSGVRIPLRDAYIGYFSGLALLFVPFLIGEVSLRAFVHRRRNGVPAATTILVNLWERLLDLVALALITAGASAVSEAPAAWLVASGVLSLATLNGAVRAALARGFTAVVAALPAALAGGRPPRGEEAAGTLAGVSTWAVALTASLAAWSLPAVGFWGLAASWGPALHLADAASAYGASSLLGGALLAPGGVHVVGARLLATLGTHGFGGEAAALTVLGVRLATAGLATVLGATFVWIHRNQAATGEGAHFEEISQVYDAQLPEARRLALLARKTELMQRALDGRGGGRHGLDVGCGRGYYVARMRDLGFAVAGIDESAGQVEAARRNVGDPAAILQGSAFHLPLADASFDFVYTINVLHHLRSLPEQRAVFAEMERVLRPGGLLFVHEINTRNVLFRFYMRYVYPALNCIDEGVELWLPPHRLGAYTAAPVLETAYFTFLPEFLPAAVVRLLSPLERTLERSRWRVYSAHYMAVLRKPASTGTGADAAALQAHS